MSWTEVQPCRFHAYPDGKGQPSRIYVEIDRLGPSLLPNKLMGRIYFSLAPGTSWPEVEALEAELNAKLSRLHVNHLAAGE
jgi:hypothetical protein